MVNVSCNGKSIDLPEGSYIFEVLEKLEISADSFCCVKLDGTITDFRTPILHDCSLEFLDFDSKHGKKVYWHTTAHILAQAVKRIYGNVKFGIGPAIDEGFYYDFELEEKITPDDFAKIEAEMRNIVNENLFIEREFFTVDEARCLMEKQNQPYKLELINELSKNGAKLSFFKQGEFVDLCIGPHLKDTGAVGVVKLLSVTGAYWKADCNNKMLQRIYGISFPKQDQLVDYVKLIEEAKLRDHRKLGKDLELYSFEQEAPGFAIFLPRGMCIKNLLIDYWRKLHVEAFYSEISTPIILSRSLWETSGHWFHYKENMYTTVIDRSDFAIKPMNCPGAILVYRLNLHSYKEFPLRFCELGTVHRHELSGTLHGLMRARSFTQDDAHIFLMQSQIKDEVIEIIKLIDGVYRKFGFTYSLEISTMPKSHIGDVSDWEVATNSLKEAVAEFGLAYEINEGDGAFYGPKIDFHLQDCLKRRWQCGTIQLDFQLPKAFELEYVGSDGQRHRPIMIHRVAFGSIERFIGILVEHYAGAFPFWLAPVQICILPISDNFKDYARFVKKKLTEFSAFRIEIDDRNEKIGYRLREAQLKKTPYTIVVGEKEREKTSVSVREYGKKIAEVKDLKSFATEILNRLKS